jgi:hypothetical protein
LQRQHHRVEQEVALLPSVVIGLICFHSAASRRQYRCCLRGCERGGADRVATRFLLELYLIAAGIGVDFTPVEGSPSPLRQDPAHPFVRPIIMDFSFGIEKSFHFFFDGHFGPRFLHRFAPSRSAPLARISHTTLA